MNRRVDKCEREREREGQGRTRDREGGAKHDSFEGNAESENGFDIDFPITRADSQRRSPI